MTKAKRRERPEKEPTAEQIAGIQRRLAEVRESAAFKARAQKTEERLSKQCVAQRYTWHFINNEIIFEGAN